MGTLLQDLRYGIRMLAKSPGFTALAVITLALGIGANTAIFSVINSVVLRPLPFHEPGRLVALWETESAPGNFPLTGPDYLDWQAQNRTLEASSLYTWDRTANASGSGEPQAASVISTQANFFAVLGVQPQIGRAFDPGEDRAGKNHVAILSNAFWHRQFGGRSDVLGKTIELNDEPYFVIGVLPAWFNFQHATEIWTPMDMTPKALGPRGSHSYRAIARLQANVTAAQAQAELAGITKRLAKQNSKSDDISGAVVVSLTEQLTDHGSADVITFRILFCQPLGNAGEFRLSLCRGDVRLQPGDRAIGMRTARPQRLGRHVHGRPNFRRVLKIEPRGQDADHGVGLVIQFDGFARDVGAAAELPLPEGAAQNRYMIFSVLIFAGIESAPDLRL